MVLLRTSRLPKRVRCLVAKLFKYLVDRVVTQFILSLLVCFPLVLPLSPMGVAPFLFLEPNPHYPLPHFFYFGNPDYFVLFSNFPRTSVTTSLQGKQTS